MVWIFFIYQRIVDYTFVLGGGQVHKNIDISISEMGYGLKAKGIIRGDHSFYSLRLSLFLIMLTLQ